MHRSPNVTPAPPWPPARQCHDALFEDALVRRVVHAFADVCRELGPGFAAGVYTEALCVELAGRGFRVDRDVGADIRYGGVVVGTFTADLIVESHLVVHVRTGGDAGAAAQRHLRCCLRATGLGAGVLLRPGARPSHQAVTTASPPGPRRSVEGLDLRNGAGRRHGAGHRHGALAAAVRESLRQQTLSADSGSGRIASGAAEQPAPLVTEGRREGDDSAGDA